MSDLVAAASSARSDRKPRRDHPEGWEPGIRWDGPEGTLVTKPKPVSGSPDPTGSGEPWDDHLREWGFDPDIFQVIEPVQFRTWDAMIKNDDTQEMVVRRMVYYRATVITRSKVALEDPDLQDWILRWRPRKLATATQDRALVVALADWQVGCGDGDGTDGTVGRVLDMIEQVRDRWRDVKGDRLVVLGLGDLVEGCSGWYPMQEWTADMDGREQRRTVRRLLAKAVKEWSDIAPQVIVAPVGGNHGENRANGKAFTTFADNSDVEVVESVADEFAANPDRFGHVSWAIPHDELVQTIDVHGQIIGVTHGHLGKTGGSKPVQKIERWWQGQMMGDHPVGDADILVSGHFHHLTVQHLGPRTWMQCPAMDGGSKWFSDSVGMDSPAGTLTFTVGRDGWDDLHVIKAERSPAP